METPTQITERRIGTVTILDILGRLVLGEGDTAFQERIDALIRQDRFDIVLNFRDVSYIDSCGIGALVDRYLSVRRRNGDLKLLNLSERTRHVLGIMHLLSVFEVFRSEGDAVRSFAFRHAAKLRLKLASDDERRYANLRY